MKTTIQTSTPIKNKAFSLVEMLVVIAVIGIVSAIAVPMVTNATGKAGEASHQRTAQTLSTMATNAIASGNLTMLDAANAEEVVEMLIVGVEGTGAFEGTTFQVNSMSDADRLAVVAMLSWEGGTLQYVPG